jgi:uncharacterized membrane protein YciS (DUF1049 family)
MKRLLAWTIAIGLFIGLLWTGWSFRAGNAAPITLDLIWIRVPDVELWRVILVSIAMGAILAGTILGLAWMRVRLLNHRYRRAIGRLESELHEMRSLPLSKGETEFAQGASAELVGAQR